MARFFDKTTRGDALEVITPIAATYPFTASVWFEFATSTSGGFALASSDPSAATNYWNLNVSYGGAGQLQFYQGANSGIIFGSGPTVSDFNWHHIACVITNATTRALYVDGVKTAGSGTSVTMTGLSQLVIGGFYVTGGSPVRNPGWDGNLAEVAGWNVALTDPEVVALARGASPMQVRPSGLILYYPLTDGTDGKYLRNRFRNATDRSLAEVGTGTQACSDGTHPPVQPGFGFVGGWRGTTPPLAVILLAPNMAVGSPVLGTPALTGPTIIPEATAYFKTGSDAGTTDATGYTTIANTLLGVSLVSVVAGPSLAAADFAVGAPAIGVGTLGQKHVLAAPTLAAGAPVVPAAGLGQAHVLNASALAVGAPALGAPGTGRVFNLDPDDAAAGAPVLGTPAIGQKHALIGATAAAGSPVLGTGALKQKHVLAATGLAVSSPALSAPAASQGAPVPGRGFTVASPAIGTGTLKQKQVLAAGSLAVSVPVFGQPVLAKSLFAVSLATSAPVIAPVPPGVTRSFVLLAGDLVVGSPTFLPPPNAEEIAPPVVWLRCKLERWSRDPHSKFYDDDNTQYGRPVKQAIFANLNDDIEATMSSGTLGGRTSPERGPMETIIVSKPLWLADKKLGIDWSEVEAATNAAIAAEIAARSAAITAEITARSNADTAEATTRNNADSAEITARSNADTTEATTRSAADSALDARLVVLETRTYVDMGGVANISPASGFVHDVAANAGAVIVNLPSNISSGTFRLPIAPTGRQKIDFIILKNIANVTFSTANTGHALANPPTSASGGKNITAVFGPVLQTWLFFS